jgi:DNA repair protein RadC
MDTEIKKPTIKHWAEEDRPREKMASKGRSELTDAELLAILIGSGTRELTAVDLAKVLLDCAENDLNKLGRMSINDFCRIKGIGSARAITITAALELGRRRKDADRQKIEKIRSSRDIYDLMSARLAEADCEEFWMLYLGRNNAVLCKNCISKGGTSQTSVDVKIVVKHALDNLAAAAVAVHNHPSGNVAPSPQDHSLTSKIKTALLYFDISLLDHVIISREGYFSFADEDVL